MNIHGIDFKTYLYVLFYHQRCFFPLVTGENNRSVLTTEENTVIFSLASAKIELCLLVLDVFFQLCRSGVFNYVLFLQQRDIPFLILIIHIIFLFCFHYFQNYILSFSLFETLFPFSVFTLFSGVEFFLIIKHHQG